MLIPKKMKESKRLILVVVLLFALIGIGYLIYANFLALPVIPTESFMGLNLDMPQVTISQFSSDLNTDFLTKSPYQDLRLPSQAKLPVAVDKTGRIDPFQKVSFYLLDSESDQSEEGASAEATNETERRSR